MAKMGRKFEFGPHHFSFPPSHLFNFLAPLLSSSSGKSLTARVVENQYSFRVCACVRLHVCVCAGERERERDSVYVCVQTGRARGVRFLCAAALPSNPRPILPGYRSGSDPSAAPRLADFHINPPWSGSDTSFQSYPPSPPTPLSFSPYLPLPVTHLFPC